MFINIINALREAVGAFDVSDTPVEPVSKPKMRPPAPPLKALRGYKPPAKKAKLPGMPMESTKFGAVIGEMRELIERMMKSGMPKVDRQDAMARRAGVDVNMPQDLHTARSRAKNVQKPDQLAAKASTKEWLKNAQKKRIVPIGAKSTPTGVASVPHIRADLKKRFGR
jgi:hypothetical protein